MERVVFIRKDIEYEEKYQAPTSVIFGGVFILFDVFLETI